MKWTALLLAVLILCPIAVGFGVAANAHFIKPVDTTAFPVVAETPALLDPIDTDGPGGVCSVAFGVDAA